MDVGKSLRLWRAGASASVRTRGALKWPRPEGQATGKARGKGSKARGKGSSDSLRKAVHIVAQLGPHAFSEDLTRAHAWWS